MQPHYLSLVTNVRPPTHFINACTVILRKKNFLFKDIYSNIIPLFSTHPLQHNPLNTFTPKPLFLVASIPSAAASSFLFPTPTWNVRSILAGLAVRIPSLLLPFTFPWHHGLQGNINHVTGFPSATLPPTHTTLHGRTPRTFLRFRNFVYLRSD